MPYNNKVNITSKSQMRSLLVYLLSLLQIILYPSLLFADESELLANLISKLESVKWWGAAAVKRPEKVSKENFQYENTSDADTASIIEKIGSIRRKWRDENFLFPDPFSETGPTLAEWSESVSFFTNNLKDNNTNIRLLSLRALREISRIEQKKAVSRFDGKVPRTRSLLDSVLLSIHRELFWRGDNDLEGWDSLLNEREDLIYELEDFYKELSPYDGDFDGIDDTEFLLLEDYDECYGEYKMPPAGTVAEWRQALTWAVRLTECRDGAQRGIGYDAIGEMARPETMNGDRTFSLIDVARVALRLGMLREKFLFQIVSHESFPYDSDISDFINRIDAESLRQTHVVLFQKALAAYKRIFPLDYDFSGTSLDANDIDFEIKLSLAALKADRTTAAQNALEELRKSESLLLSDSVIKWGKEKKGREDVFPKDYEKREIFRIAHKEYVEEVLERDVKSPPNLDKYIGGLERATNSLQEVLDRSSEYETQEIVELVEGFFDALYEHISVLLSREPALATILISKFYRFLFLSIEHMPDEIKETLGSNERLFIEDNKITLSPSTLLKHEIEGIRGKIDLKRLAQLNRRIRFIENRTADDEELGPLFIEIDKIGREFFITNGQIFFLKNLTLNWVLLQAFTGRGNKLYYPGGDQIAFWLEPALQEFQYKAKMEWQMGDVNSILDERKKFMGELLIASRDLKSLSGKLIDANEQDASYLRSVKNELLFKYPILSAIVGNKDGEEFDRLAVKTPFFSAYQEPLFLWEKMAAESNMEESLTYLYRDETEDKSDKWLLLLDRALRIQEEGIRIAATLVSLGMDRETTVATPPFQKIVNRDAQFREYQIIDNRILESVSRAESIPLFLDRVVGISSWVFLGAMIFCPAFMPIWLMGAFLLDVADYESTDKKGDIYQREYLRFISNVTGSEIEVGDLNKFEAARDAYLNADWWFRFGVELNIAIPVGSTAFRGARRFIFIKRQ